MTLLFFLCLFVFIQIIIVLTRLELPSEVGFFAMNIILIVYIFAAWAFVSILLGFHIYLTFKNTTTNEFCKDSWESISGNPFSKYDWDYVGQASGKIASRYLEERNRNWEILRLRWWLGMRQSLKNRPIRAS